MESTTPDKNVWHTIVATSLGDLTLVRDADAIRGVYFPHHWYRPQEACFGSRADRGFAAVTQQIEQYLDGERRTFDVPLDPRGSAPKRRVWELVQQIPYGQTTTYGELAATLGEGVTAQEIGAAVGRNPLCILIPCHRVVGKGGRLTGYAGGLERKAKLLELEQVRPSDMNHNLTDSLQRASS
jgi:methylated-DNA-[protein]-cysteine S-methyltransferase